MKAFERLWIGILSLSLLAFSFQTASAEPITVVSWGGSYGKAQDRALFTDASNHSGIAINRESGASMTKTCLQVQSGSVHGTLWSLVLVEQPQPPQTDALKKLITVSWMLVIFILVCIRITVWAPTFLPR